MSPVARGWLRGRGAVQRNGRRRRAPCGTDELGDEIEPCYRFRSQERAPSLRAMGNQFAINFSSPLAASMLNS